MNEPDEPDKPLSIQVAWKLPGRERLDGEIQVPRGSRVADLPALLEDVRAEYVLFVRNQRMCDGTEELAPGDRIVVLPILDGG